jgi:hypothetical protein
VSTPPVLVDARDHLRKRGPPRWLWRVILRKRGSHRHFTRAGTTIGKVVWKGDAMTLSLLMYVLMIASFVALAGVLVVDAIRDVAARRARRPVRTQDPAAGRSAATGARNRHVAPTRS